MSEKRPPDSQTTAKRSKVSEAGVTVCHLGGPGTFSENAAIEFFKYDYNHTEIAFVGLPSFRKVFETVEQGEARYGVVPVENSISGSFRAVHEELASSNVSIVGEISMQEHAYLITNAGVRKEDIVRVYGHPALIMQCGAALEGYQKIIANDTATACTTIKDGKSLKEAAIGSQQSAAATGLVALERIERGTSATRYLIICKEPLPAAAYTSSQVRKCSLLLSLPNRPGALFKVFSCFAFRELNILRADMRPNVEDDILRGASSSWKYDFFLDFEYRFDEQSKVQSLFQSLNDYCTYKLLGTFACVNPGASKEEVQEQHLLAL